jgi:hypothetical protein
MATAFVRVANSEPVLLLSSFWLFLVAESAFQNVFKCCTQSHISSFSFGDRSYKVSEDTAIEHGDRSSANPYANLDPSSH